MTDKLDRFTKKARHVLTLAQEEAQRLHHGYIGTEHLLLGLIGEKNGMASKVLKSLGVKPKSVQQTIERISEPSKQASFGKAYLTPRTKRVIELAFDEARRLGHHYIGTEHLLLGLVRQGDGVAVDVLKSMGVSLEKVRTETTRGMMKNPVYAGRAGQQDERKTPLIDQLATDLTALAEEGKLDPVVGRQTEIERVIQILARRTKKQSGSHRRAGGRQDGHRGGAGPAYRDWRFTGAPARQAADTVGCRLAGSWHHIPWPVRRAT